VLNIVTFFECLFFFCNRRNLYWKTINLTHQTSPTKKQRNVHNSYVNTIKTTIKTILYMVEKCFHLLDLPWGPMRATHSLLCL
jgi:hypothetical protein